MDDFRWSRIARRLPGRTDNEIKNYWRTHLRKRAQGHRAGEEEEEDQVVQGPREGTGVKPDFSIEFHFDSRFSSDFECVGGEDQEATSTNSMNVFPLSVSEMEHDEALASNWASEITNDFVALHPLEEYDPSGYGYGYCSASNCNFWEFCAGSLWDL
ncbi:hypothetical protein H6P81_001284 [Aristolochia fimbriata]|uniref:Uncharacterized protein n=1 Tax=Aristolochia fimbriata TaxID=158543 RepID=A0AAV7F9M8_ARIFI|nr:hypothetical protein H6P81_001284 [Aristolochia fimbriata]